MDDAGFWSLIDRLDWARLGDDEAVCEPVVAALAELPPQEIHSFQLILCRKLYELDRENLARHSGPGVWSQTHLSADEFLYSRCAIVANGPRAFETVLADPTRMPKDAEFEALLEVAPTAYERPTGQPYEQSTPAAEPATP